MIKSVRLFVVWMIQTKKQTARLWNTFHKSKKKRKKKKNIKRSEIKLSDVEKWNVSQSCLSFGWFKTKRKTAPFLKSPLFNTKTFLFGSKNAFKYVFSNKSKRLKDSKRIQTKESKSSLSCKMIHSIASAVCRLIDSNQKTNSRTKRTEFHNRKRLQRQKTSTEPKTTNFLTLKSGTSLRDVCRLDDSKPNEKQQRKQCTFQQNKFFLVPKNAFFSNMSSATNQNVSKTQNVFKQRIEIFSLMQNDPLHRLVVVWMIQTKKQTAYTRVYFTTEQNRKHQKNRKQTFWC